MENPTSSITSISAEELFPPESQEQPFEDVYTKGYYATEEISPEQADSLDWAEQFVIGTVICKTSLPEATKRLTEQEFTGETHRRFWRAIMRLNEAGVSISEVAIHNDLIDHGERKPGEKEYLFNLDKAAEYGTKEDELPYYVGKIREKSASRKMCRLSKRASEELDRGRKPQEVRLRLIQELEKLGEAGSEKILISVKDGLEPVLSEFLEIKENKREIIGLPSGISDLDRATGGFRPGELTVIGGRPGQGKSSLLFAIPAYNAKNGTPALIISLEMNVQAVYRRVVYAEAGVNWQAVKTGRAMESDQTAMTEAINRLYSTEKLTVAYLNDCQLQEVKETARQWAKKNPGGIIAIDYLGYIKAPGHENRNQELGEVCRGLHDLAGELNIPILLGCQLNRELEKREGGRPKYSDLRDSGEIEQVADLILLLWLEPEENPCNPRPIRPAEIIIAKQRDGVIGAIRVQFNTRLARFENIASPKRAA